MARIVFYEKPGCINNTRQKKLLAAAGHEVQPVNLLEHPWSADQLRIYFGGKAVSECFNTTAPAIKSGAIDPANLTEHDALAAMINEPILIKRPLMAIDGTHYIQGFDQEQIDALIGLTPLLGEEETVEALQQADLVTCPREASKTVCDDNES